RHPALSPGDTPCQTLRHPGLIPTRAGFPRPGSGLNVASSDAVAGGIPRSGGGRIRGAAGQPPLAHGSTTPPGGVISAPGWAGDLLQWPWLPLVPLLAIPILGASTENIRHVILGLELIFLAKA